MLFPPKVLLDANVLYSRLLRELFMELHIEDLIQARWTEEIHSEWTRNVLKDYPDINPAVLKRTCELMNLYAEGALVTDYSDIVESLSLPDPDDRHVLAAAIHENIPTIVSFNVSDFTPTQLEPFEIEVKHPDAFLVSLFENNKASVLSLLERIRTRMKNPALNHDEFTKRLESAGLIVFSGLF
jgi:predicted nucleic acid-binding protein